MGLCPVCNNKLNASFGMVQCSKCQTVLFIDFNGNIIIGGGEDAPVDDNPPPQAEEIHQDIELEKSDYAEVGVEEGSESFATEMDAPIFADNFWPPESPEQATTEATVEDLEMAPEEHSEQDPMASEVNDPYQSPIYQNETPAAPSPLVQSQGAPAGAIVYKINIEGIDASSLRRAVLDSLRDSRLGLINDEISGSIEQGRLSIKGLNPVKASFIMKALKDLPLEINWEMYAQDTEEQTSESSESL